MTRLDDTIERLRRLGPARNRAVDTEPREITISDDEACDLVAYLDRLGAES